MTQTVVLPSCMLLLSLTQTQKLTQYIVPLQYVEFNRKQQHIQQPSQIRFPEVLQPYNDSNCVCVRVYVCDRHRFCIYHAVYGLCPSYRNSFIPHAFLCTRKYRFV